MNQETPIPTFSVLLSPTPRGARLARLLATEQLRTWGLPLDPAEHIVAELAANAATHGRVPGRDFRLTLYVIADTLRVELTDTRDDRLPQVRHDAEPDSETGRGLVIVDALAHRWGLAEGLRPRKTVWAEIVLPPEAGNPGSGAVGDQSQRTTGVREPDQAPPHPAPPSANSPSRVNIANSAGFRVG
ncbi:ATP-binding protein [Streptomyces graminofaciens]|uniref:ATP-binding protein n=1 Tax=Streptomyces graminofaciens TaxID=68212 RepID=UPI002573C59C|nr:ATP-binding protein [Streptomyces graminofaciens]